MADLYSERDGIRYPYITTTHGMSGYFAVMIWLNPDLGGFEESYQTGTGRYKSSSAAVMEGTIWAADEDIDFRDGSKVIPGGYKYAKQ